MAKLPRKIKVSQKSCGCIIIKNDKLLLICAKDDEGKSFWAFPKGEQEIGESDMETAIRETKEEVGLNVKITDEKPIIVGHPIHNGTAYKQILLFTAKPIDGELKIQKQEVEKANWVPIAEVSNYLTDYYKKAYEKFLVRTKN